MAKSRCPWAGWLAVALTFWGVEASGMRLTSQPIFATLKADVQMQSGKTDCKVCAGTKVEVIGETTVPGRPGTGYLLVRATEGPCSGARASLRREALTLIRSAP